jgi:hypothetical protein
MTPIRKYIAHFPMILILTVFACKTSSPPLSNGAETADIFPCGKDTFFYALMMQESSGNPRAVYMESFGVESLGLFQVSLQDKGPRYKCNFTDRESVFDPIKNRDCAEKILAKLRIEYPNDNIWQYGGRYFSTLRHPTYWPKARTQPYLNFKKFAESRGCKL